MTVNSSYYRQVSEASQYLRRELKKKPSMPVPALAVVLGSGLGGLADSLSARHEIPYSAIPHFPQSSVEGHSGSLLACQLKGEGILCLKGRVHYYEGHDMTQVTFPIRVLGTLGVKTLIVTNAAGGINSQYRSGDLMLIKDHIGTFVPNPLIGANENRFGPRFPDMSDAYARQLLQMAHRCARHLKIKLREGMYAGLTGPSYETPAEIQMLKRMGADAVGMSTVPDVIVARHLGMECLGISIITNLAAGISKTPLNHSAVLAAGEIVKPQLARLLMAICSELMPS
jgi:purine-nucleoside phosphorylase